MGLMSLIIHSICLEVMVREMQREKQIGRKIDTRKRVEMERGIERKREMV